MLLITIVLLSYSKCWSQNEVSSLQGGDSVLVAISDLKLANIKMTQLKFANEKIVTLSNIVKTDSCEIEVLKTINEELKKQNAKHIKHKTILCGISFAGIISSVFLLFK